MCMVRKGVYPEITEPCVLLQSLSKQGADSEAEAGERKRPVLSEHEEDHGYGEGRSELCEGRAEDGGER